MSVISHADGKWGGDGVSGMRYNVRLSRRILPGHCLLPNLDVGYDDGTVNVSCCTSSA